MRKQTAYWTTKTGERIRICDMIDSHLANTIRLLEGMAKATNAANLNAAYAASMYLQGEQASYECDRAISVMEEDHDGEYELPDIYWKLVEERHRRALLPTRNQKSRSPNAK